MESAYSLYVYAHQTMGVCVAVGVCIHLYAVLSPGSLINITNWTMHLFMYSCTWASD